MSSDTNGVSAEDLREWDRRHVWHPFTPIDPYLGSDAPVIVRGQGVRLQDTEGRWYYDGSSSIWLNVHGHRTPELDEALRRQLDRVAHATLLGQGSATAAELAKRLVDITPAGLEKVFFSDSGATAVEVALKMAIQYFANVGERKRHKIVGFTHNYHGDTLGAMSVAPDETFHWPFLEQLPRHPRVPYPFRLGMRDPKVAQLCLDHSITRLRELLQTQGDEIAGVIVEPVEGAGGILPAPVGFLRALRQLCDDYGVLLIVDEVATGFGRTGEWFACTAEEITPDILCVGKGLTGGYLPVAATLTRDSLYERFRGARRNTLFHGHSYTGNALGCAVALANLDLMQQRLPQWRRHVPLIEELLQPLERNPFVAEVRQRGFMVGIELMQDVSARRQFPADLTVGLRVADRARQHGLLIRPIGAVLIFMPPLASTPQELQEMIAILGRALEDSTAELQQLARRHGSASGDPGAADGEVARELGCYDPAHGSAGHPAPSSSRAKEEQ